MICIGPIETHYGIEYHDELEVESKENCSRCLGIFNAEVLLIGVDEKYQEICEDYERARRHDVV